MASALHHHPQLEFQPRPVTHAPSPLGFGFGLSSSSTPFASAGFGRPSSSTTPQFPFQHLASAMTSAGGQPSPQRAGKRRHDGDDDLENDTRTGRDVTMDRSPTPPDRPKRGVPKRGRFVATAEDMKDAKGKSTKNSGDEVDVGVLLASLPSAALLPILTSLLAAHPELKDAVIPLIPRPTLDTAVQAIASSAKKLRDAYPFSSTSTFSSPASFSGFGATQRSSTSSPWGTAHSFAAGSPHHTASSSNPTPGMRDDYVLSRLSAPISEFISTCMTYLPYFSHASMALQPGQAAPSTHAQVKEKAHPNETFQFLAAITGHILSQPPLARSSLAPQLLPRLVDEWTAWIKRVDSVVNHEGGMFGQETVRQWERSLDEYATAKDHGLEVMSTLRDRWVGSVGWLVGRQLMMQS